MPATKTRPPSDNPANASEEPGTGVAKGLTNYGDKGFSLFQRKAFIRGAGYTDDAQTRPIIGIVNTGSAYNPCHGNAAQLIDAGKRGIMLAGGLPRDFPTISVHESFSQPTSMYLRNLMAMDTEEMIRAQPMDAVVLIVGCDKTVPAQLMGAASAGISGDPAGDRLHADRLASRPTRRPRLRAGRGAAVLESDLSARRHRGAAGKSRAGRRVHHAVGRRAGVKDMARISDGRMSGTAAGTIVLHVTPEAAIGGPLAHVRNGDRIRLSVARRELSLLVSGQELAQRIRTHPVTPSSAERGYRKRSLRAVTQADKGEDFDFLRAATTRAIIPGPK